MGNINIPDSALFQAGAGPDLKLTHDGSNSTISNATGTLTINNIANSSMILGTNNTTALTITNGQAATFAGNVTVSDRVVGSSDLILVTTDSNEKIHMDSDGYIKFETAGSEAMRIDSSQNVGIGTSSPGYPLVVEGTSSALGDSRTILEIRDDTSMASGVGGGIAFSGVYTGSSITRLASIWSEKENGTDDEYGGQLHLGTRVNGGTISSDLVIDSAGKVGIGTASPDSHLHIKESSNGTNAVFHLEAAGGSGTENAIIRLTNPSDAWDIYVEDNTGSGDLRFYNGADRVTIEPGGNVGIGTTSPTSGCKLHIKDSDAQIKLEGTAGSNSSFIDFNGTDLQISTNRDQKTGTFSNASKSNATITLAGSDGGSNIKFYTASANNTTNTERMRIDSAGVIQLRDGMIVTKNNGSSTNAYMSIGHDADYGQIGAGESGIWGVNNNDMIFGTNDTLAFTIDNSQEGIFSGALHLGSNQSNKEMFTVKGYNNRVMRLKTLSSDRQWQWGLNTGSPMYYSVKNYSSSGSTFFGIGVVPAGYTCDVAGNLNYSGTLSNNSLRELKEDIVEIDGTGMIEKLKKVPLYKYNTKATPMAFKSTDEVYNKNKMKYGIMADDAVNLQEFPELINWAKREEDSEAKIEGIDTTTYIGILHGAIKELISKVEALENA